MTLYYDRQFLVDEDIITKVQYVQDMELHSQYRAFKGNGIHESYYQKIKKTLDNIPEEFKKAALALFANVIYLPQDLLESAWIFICNELYKSYEMKKETIPEQCWIAEFDTQGLSTEFIHLNGIEGRLDWPRITSPSALIDKLAQLVNDSENTSIISDIKNILSKRFWLLLVDNALSGTSLLSEIKKLVTIMKLLSDKFPVPRLVVCCQIITSIAIQKLKDTFGEKFEYFDIQYALKFDSKVSIASEGCTLFSNLEILEKVRCFCNWLAEKFISKDEKYKETQKLSENNLAFGFKQCGWTIVTYKNCPSDSVPPIWYKSPMTKDPELFEKHYYCGPFPRDISRIIQKTSFDKDNLTKLDSYKESIFKSLI